MGKGSVHGSELMAKNNTLARWIHLRRLPERTIMLPSNLPSKQDVQQGIPDTSWNYLATKMMVKVLRDTGFRQYG